MKLDNIREQYLTGKLDKWRYIDEMYTIHDQLFNYSSFIESTNISEIKIVDNQVEMLFRDSQVKFICIEGDKRLAPLDTINFGTYEMEELQIQLKLMDEKTVIFDIGANLGWYALHVAKKKVESEVHSFEPVPATFDYLVKNVGINNLVNIFPHNFGFSEEKGIKSFYINPSLSVNASLANVADSDEIHEIKCNFDRLDNYCASNNIYPDFIKCDVEGAELLVFKGSRQVLQEKKPIVFTEMLRKWTAKFNYHPNDIINLFSDLGYGCFVIQNEGLKSISNVTDNTPETNYIFLHTEKHADKIDRLVK